MFSFNSLCFYTVIGTLVAYIYYIYIYYITWCVVQSVISTIDVYRHTYRLFSEKDDDFIFKGSNILSCTHFLNPPV